MLGCDILRGQRIFGDIGCCRQKAASERALQRQELSLKEREEAFEALARRVYEM